MTAYLTRRLLQAVITIFAVVSLTFLFGRVSGSPAYALLGDNATTDQIRQLNDELGFSKPLAQQYIDYLVGLLHGDFGNSYGQRGVSSMSLTLDRLPASLLIGAVGLAAGVTLALAVALTIQLTGSRTLRTVALALGSARQSVPDFLFGLLLVLVLSVKLGLLPSLGRHGPESLIMPAVVIATGVFVLYTRLIDNSLSEQASADYVRTAYARGESRSRVVLADMLPNALLPLLTVVGINLGAFLGGVLIIENVFAWPGLGQLTLNAVHARDFPVVQSSLIVVAALFVLCNLAADIAYGLIDPRVRLQ